MHHNTENLRLHERLKFKLFCASTLALELYYFNKTRKFSVLALKVPILLN